MTKPIDGVKLGLPNLLGHPNLLLCGQMGSGKSSGARFLADTLLYKHMSIAGTHPGGIRDIATRLWGPEALNDRSKLNALAMIDDAYPGTWLAALQREINPSAPQLQPIVIDDVRRELEYDAFVGEGFVPVWISAPEEQRIARLTASGKWQGREQLTTKWETGLDHIVFQYTITNDGTQTEFENELVNVVLKERKNR